MLGYRYVALELVEFEDRLMVRALLHIKVNGRCVLRWPYFRLESET